AFQTVGRVAVPPEEMRRCSGAEQGHGVSRIPPEGLVEKRGRTVGVTLSKRLPRGLRRSIGYHLTRDRRDRRDRPHRRERQGHQQAVLHATWVEEVRLYTGGGLRERITATDCAVSFKELQRLESPGACVSSRLAPLSEARIPDPSNTGTSHRPPLLMRGTS